MRISDWSSDVCSSDLSAQPRRLVRIWRVEQQRERIGDVVVGRLPLPFAQRIQRPSFVAQLVEQHFAVGTQAIAHVRGRQLFKLRDRAIADALTAREILRVGRRQPMDWTSALWGEKGA